MVSTTKISDFLAQKSVSEASKKAYFYDLEQFLDLVEGNINATSLLYYQEFLKSLKTSAQKRKHSSVNQFLLYLYDSGAIERYYHLAKVREPLPSPKKQQTLDVSFLDRDSDYPTGRLIASFIAMVGLTLKEMADLKYDMIDRDFRVIKVLRDGQLRILPLPQLILDLLPEGSADTYLFGHGDKPYSRQWFFLQLKTYLASVGLKDVTAQLLRQQFINHQKALGKDAGDIAKLLGLKSTQTIEKYFN